MIDTPASLGDATDAGSVSILDLPPQSGPQILVDGVGQPLPSSLQPDIGDTLLAQAMWPWKDLGAQSAPEQWLYMSRKVKGVVAQLTVQTSAGPKLVKAASDGTIVAAMTAQPPTGGATQPLVIDPRGNLYVSDNSFDLLKSFDAIILAGASLELIAGLGGNNLYYRALVVTVVTVSAGGFAECRGTTSLDQLAVWPTDLQIEHRYGPLNHKLGDTGDGIEIVNHAPGSIRVSGTLVYRVQTP